MSEHRHRAQSDHQQGQRPQRVVAGLRPALPTREPVPPPDQHHAHVEHDQQDRGEIGQSAQGQHAVAEIGESLADAPALDGQHGLLAGAAEDRVGRGEEHQRHVEQYAQHKADGNVAGQERGDHADGQHRQPHQPVADVRPQEQTDVELRHHGEGGLRAGQIVQHQVVAEHGEQQRNAENAHRRQILAQHDVEIGGGDGQQQFVGPLFPLVRPDAHRDRGDIHEHDEREPEAKLVQVGQVVAEEVRHPKSGNRAERHKQKDEQVARGTGEVTDEVTSENGH